MDETTRVLICIGAATAANCEPCFGHFFGKAQELKLPEAQVQTAIDLGHQMKQGAQLSLQRAIRAMMEGSKTQEASCGCGCE